jgi:hypothetical protein
MKGGGALFGSGKPLQLNARTGKMILTTCSYKLSIYVLELTLSMPMSYHSYKLPICVLEL